MSIQRMTVIAAIVLCFFWGSVIYGQDASFDFRGTVHSLSKDNLSLDKKFEWAQKEFKKSSQGHFYFTGYRFLSRDKIHMGGDCEPDESFKVTVKGEKIKVRMRSIRREGGDLSESVRGKVPAALVFLHKVTQDKDAVTDMHILDLDRTYEFDQTPVFWLGNVDNGESLEFLEDQLEKGERKIQDSCVFAIYLHDHPRVYDRLYDIARGEYGTGIRKNTIFWIGNFKDEKSFGYLKKILKEEKNTELKEQAVFALQLNDTDKAVKELIHIAQNDGSKKVRKSAVFWLGQKASKESIKALKDVIEEPDEDTGMKESAVFAISQLPKNEAVPMLIGIAKTNKNSKVRKQAIFWLGQTGDEDALKFFEEILLKK